MAFGEVRNRFSKKLNWYRYLTFFFLVVFWAGHSLAATTLHFGVAAPLNHPWTKGIINLKEQISLASKGKIELEVLPEPIAGGSMDLLRKVQENTIDMGLLSTYSLGDYVDAMRVFRLPFAFRDKAQARIATSGELAEQLLNEAKRQRLISLYFVPSEYNVVINRKRPITTLEDLKGLKIATVAGPIQIDALRSLGATPVTLPGAEIYTALEKGVVNGAEGPPSFFCYTGFYKVAKYVTSLSINYIPGVFIASPRKWSSIPEEQKKLIKESIPPVVEGIDNELETNRTAAIEKMIESGAAFYYPSSEDIAMFREAVRPIYMYEKRQIPKPYWQVAYNAAYVKRDLQVCSKPDGATVFYRRDGDKYYEKYHILTDTSISLEYAAWYIKVKKEKYKPEEKYFNPYHSRRWRVDFELQKIN
jgi:TRAP-type C4-dicarboxylate transport system substrate-binding protein